MLEQNTGFSLGQLVATQGAIEALKTLQMSHMLLVIRHQSCDWGDVDQQDWLANDRALKNGERLLSAYVIQDVKFWMITEADRSATTILLPEEY